MDAHVGRHIFDQCICSLLQDSTRILVSHQLQYLPAADVVVVMRGGTISDLGGYEELLSRGVDLSFVVKESEHDEAASPLPLNESRPVNPSIPVPPNSETSISLENKLETRQQCTPILGSPTKARWTHSTLSESDRISLLNTLTQKEKDGKVTKVSRG